MATNFSICFLFTLNCVIFSTIYGHVNGIFCEEITEGIEIKRVEKTSHLHFFFHDVISGKKPSAVKIAGPTNSSAYGFGATMMMDDALTEGPEISSKPVGRAQGIYGIAAQEDVSLLMVMNMAFTEGTYNGSSISILGRNPVFNDVREMPIVGGSGVFRFARGYALAHTVWFDYTLEMLPSSTMCMCHIIECTTDHPVISHKHNAAVASFLLL
ncbi:Dirigent protein 21 [Hibiscus syriacus]|uniref:Dirigent protein n=1 Tax=Hibiscus syriacus TaxID=106335 RepID=A0A6A2ZVP4_HIBSY|nr:Dirigent protein 21 [Hibiscus syriacus]